MPVGNILYLDNNKKNKVLLLFRANSSYANAPQSDFVRTLSLFLCHYKCISTPHAALVVLTVSVRVQSVPLTTDTDKFETEKLDRDLRRARPG